MIYTSANSHLGDTCWAAHILRRIGGQHTFYVPKGYMRCIAECLEGTDIEVKEITHSPPGALSTWIACGRYEGQGVQWRNQIDLVTFLLSFANAMARECGVAKTLFKERTDMLCDFPMVERYTDAPEFDVLVVNAHPLSGQATGWNGNEMNALIAKLAEKNRVLCTNETPVDVLRFSGSICGIGNLSCHAKMIVAVSTGASVCIHNVWNGAVPTKLFLAPIVLDYGRTNLHHFNNCAEMTVELEQEGWL